MKKSSKQTQKQAITIITMDPPEKYSDGAQGTDKTGTSSCLAVVLVLVIGLILLGLMVTNRHRRGSKHHRWLTACKSNMKNIATALEMYATDNKGHYPSSIKALTPNYLKTIPSCPSAGTNWVYENSYTSATVPDAYTFYCSGSNHLKAKIPANYPLYTSKNGLVDRP